MLNIMTKPEKVKVQIKATLFEKGIYFYLPKEYAGVYSLQVTDGKSYIYPDVNGNSAVDYTKSGVFEKVNVISLYFGLKHIPFKTFRSKKCKIDAMFDPHTKTFTFEMPKFEPKEENIPSRGSKSFTDLRNAINEVNNLSRKYNCELSVTGNTLSGTIVV